MLNGNYPGQLVCNACGTADRRAQKGSSASHMRQGRASGKGRGRAAAKQAAARTALAAEDCMEEDEGEGSGAAAIEQEAEEAAAAQHGLPEPIQVHLLYHDHNHHSKGCPARATALLASYLLCVCSLVGMLTVLQCRQQHHKMPCKVKYGHKPLILVCATHMSSLTHWCQCFSHCMIEAAVQ